jgi:hypothetical protein
MNSIIRGRRTAGEPWRKAMKAVKVCGVVALGALAMGGCTPDWATNGNSPVVLLMTAINDGTPLQSDVALSNGGVCRDTVPLRLENHFKNPNVASTGFRHDFTVERYEVHYFRSDGRNVEGVDVPFAITGNVSQEVIEDSAATLRLEVVRLQAKLEPPLINLVQVGPGQGGGGGLVVTMFADITLHARTTTGDVLNPVSGRLQIDFANFGDALTTCPTE